MYSLNYLEPLNHILASRISIKPQALKRLRTCVRHNRMSYVEIAETIQLVVERRLHCFRGARVVVLD